MRSAAAEKKHPGTSPLGRWYCMHSQHIPFLGHGSYVQVQWILFSLALHSMALPLFADVLFGYTLLLITGYTKRLI